MTLVKLLLSLLLLQTFSEGKDDTHTHKLFLYLYIDFSLAYNGFYTGQKHEFKCQIIGARTNRLKCFSHFSF